MAPNSVIDSKSLQLFKFKSNLNHLINLPDIALVVLYPPELGFDKTDHCVFPQKAVFFIWSMADVFHLVGGRRPVVGYAYGRWSVVFMVGAIGGRCRSAFQSVVGVLCFLWSVVGCFSTMVGGRCSIQYLVGGSWHKVGGRWSVVGGWSVGGGFVPRLPYIHSPHEIISTVCDSPYKIIEKCF